MRYFAISQFGITLKNVNKQSRFEKEMFHGHVITNNGVRNYYKNIFIPCKIAKPNFDFVVSKEIYELLKEYSAIEFQKFDNLKFFYFSYVGNKNEAFNFKLAKEPDYSDYFESLKFIDSSGYDFYEMSLESIEKVSDNNIIKIKELDNWGMYFDKEKIAKLEKFKTFSYSRVSFFNEEIYSIIKPHLNMDFFEVVEVDIPV